MHFGDLTRYINSSRDPNCYPMVKSVYGDKRIGLYALRDIDEGEELTFDYMQSKEIKLLSIGGCVFIIMAVRE